MSKHLTKKERELREQAEDGVLPDRGREAKLKKPAIVSSNKRAISLGFAADGMISPPRQPKTLIGEIFSQTRVLAVIRFRQGRLDAVHRPGESAKPVPLLPLPQNHGGTVAKAAEKQA